MDLIRGDLNLKSTSKLNDKMGTTAIIGGSGLDAIEELEITNRKVVRTPYGDPSGIVIAGNLYGKSFVFLPRHGSTHTIPPHKVNYRANIWALKDYGVDTIIAFAAVGAIDDNLVPGTVVIPDQLIDYTWGREHTFFDGTSEIVQHVEFDSPYSAGTRSQLIEAAKQADVAAIAHGTYAVTQGPRFETPAEIVKLERDGATIVGMTGMPEAVLARELQIDYACVAIVVNPAAGKGNEAISLEKIEKFLETGSATALSILKYF